MRFWRRFAPLTVTDEELERTRETSCEWSVVVEQGEPVVVAAERRRPATLRGFVDASAVEKGAPGYLVGFDYGEFGGSLGWFSLQGTLERRLLVELAGAPDANAVEPGGSLLIATREGLFRLSPAFDVAQLLEASWTARSLTLEGDTVYVGMRGEVAAVRLSGKRATATWFLPPWTRAGE